MRIVPVIPVAKEFIERLAKARAGLVQRRVQVKTRNGTHSRMQWVRPENDRAWGEKEQPGLFDDLPAAARKPEPKATPTPKENTKLAQAEDKIDQLKSRIKVTEKVGGTTAMLKKELADKEKEAKGLREQPKPAQTKTNLSLESLQKEVYGLAVQKVKLQKELKAVDDSWYTREEINHGGKFIRQNVKKVVTKEERDAEIIRLNGEIEKLDKQGQEKTRALQEAEKKVENKPSESSSNIEAVDSYDDKGNGVKTELYKYREGKNAGMYGVRVIDTDADRVVPPIRIYADETKARAAYLEAAGIKNPTVAEPTMEQAQIARNMLRDMSREAAIEYAEKIAGRKVPMSVDYAAVAEILKHGVGKPSREEMAKEAARWKGAALKIAQEIGDDKKAALNHSKMTIKADLDAYLKRKFGIDAVTAREVSNHLTDKNIPADMSANLEDFKDEPWYANRPKSAVAKETYENRKLGYQHARTSVDDEYSTEAMAAIALSNMKTGERFPVGRTWYTVSNITDKMLTVTGEDGEKKTFKPSGSKWEALVRDVGGAILGSHHGVDAGDLVTAFMRDPAARREGGMLSIKDTIPPLKKSVVDLFREGLSKAFGTR